MIKEDFDEKTNRRRPYKRWLDLIEVDTGHAVATVEKYAKDKNTWRKNVNIRWAKRL